MVAAHAAMDCPSLDSAHSATSSRAEAALSHLPAQACDTLVNRAGGLRTSGLVRRADRRAARRR
eukprot:8247426-Alexandrium_andersonii.AAC.1